MYTLHPKIVRDNGVSSYGKRGDIPLRVNRQDFDKEGKIDTDPLHFHKQSIQFFIVTEGVFRVKVGGDIVDVDKDSVLEIDPSTPYQDYEVLKAPCTCLTIGTFNNADDRVDVGE